MDQGEWWLQKQGRRQEDGAAQLARAAEEVLAGAVDDAAARLDASRHLDLLSRSHSVIGLLHALLIDPRRREIDQVTLPAARALARDPDLLTLATVPVLYLARGLEKERQLDNKEARYSYGEVLRDDRASPVLVGIARYLLARQHVLVDRQAARRYGDALLASPDEDLQALGRTFTKDFGWAMDNLFSD